ncbi:MAG: hypothetical protein ACKVOU_05275 [Cytophagales bacterium]
MEKLLVEFDCSKVYYDDESKIGTIIWNGAPSFDEYKKPFMHLLNLGKTKPVDCVMSDITNQGVISVNNRRWFESDMLPTAISLGLKRIAVVSSDNPFKKYYINMLFLSFRKFDLQMKAFSSQQSAKEWMMS